MSELSQRIFRATAGRVAGADFTMVTRKQLTESDLSSRLEMPEGKFLDVEFLSGEEKRRLKEDWKLKVGEFVVMGKDPDSSAHRIGEDVMFLKWRTGSRFMYSLAGPGWKSVMKMKEDGAVDFRQGDEVELWAFRSSANSELCFALVNAAVRLVKN
ncbi:hypothetical protein LINGRAHAP2_LOCUS16555 [Linum grandiflorum]